MNTKKIERIDNEIARSLLFTKWCSTRNLSPERLVMSQNRKGIGFVVNMICVLSALVLLQELDIDILVSPFKTLLIATGFALVGSLVIKFLTAEYKVGRIFLKDFNRLRDQCDSPEIDHVFGHMYHEDREEDLTSYITKRLDTSIEDLLAEERLRDATIPEKRERIVNFYHTLFFV